MDSTKDTTSYYSLTEDNKVQVAELIKKAPRPTNSSNYTTCSSNSSYDNHEHYYVPSSKTVLNARYNLLDYLGRGHFSSVFKAYDQEQKKIVAIKVYRAKDYYTKKGKDELEMLRHVQSHVDIRNKYLVEIFNSFYHKNHLCIVLECLYGDLLREMKPNFDENELKCKGIGLKRAKSITRNLLKAMCYISELNIIHGDIKPNNIATRKQGSSKIKLLDFGASQFDNKENNKKGKRFGTLVYSAPELTMKLPYNKSADMWSLGCTVYEIVTGKLLFKALTDFELIGQMLELLGAPERGQVREWLKESKQVKLYFHQSGKQRRLPQRHISHHGKMSMSSQGTYESYWAGEPPSLYALLKRYHSADLVDFISKCLFWNPFERMTPEMALQHPWVCPK